VYFVSKAISSVKHHFLSDLYIVLRVRVSCGVRECCFVCRVFRLSHITQYSIAYIPCNASDV
jgi:hypothetical protein